MAVLHIPDNIYRHAFDKNAPVQLLSLLIVAAISLAIIALKSHRFRFARFPLYAVGGVVAVQFSSLLMSGNLIGSLIGDAGRFVGVASALGLISIAIVHTQFKFDAFLYLLRFYLAAVQLVVFAGIAQHFNLIEFPGDQGLSSTLGNSDFFSAYVATSAPLLLILFYSSSIRGRLLVIAVGLLDLWALRLAGPLQGYLDVAFLILGVAIYLVRKYLPRRELTLNFRTVLGTLAIAIWAEFIFLMPFLGDFIPVLGNDVQVKIRSNFWLAGTRQFFSHPILGVGPDQYGNYYEQYRTLEDVQQYTNILSNDAHSASVQTLATLGILGAIAYLALITLVVRSWLVLWDKRIIERKYLYAIALYIFIYLTNSFISPITLTNKYLFWAFCGFTVGQVYRAKPHRAFSSLKVRALSIMTSVTLLVLAITFAQGQINFMKNIEKYAENNAAVIDYRPSPMLPCFMYFDAEQLIAANHGNDFAVASAQEKLKNNPRCVAAEIFLAKTAINLDRIDALKEHVYRLAQIAPMRGDTISFGMYYVNRTGDRALHKELQKTMKALGLVYIPGTLG